ncbi:ankyrin repeat domain-containing protein [Leptospira langatensis]|uniref:Ankyrin repeat domain-containing protein n=1 Tax=Leptospira langatensis TaxID=2484983 RepID=A0A5F1ZWW7_9LEPT|nr:ankyrin repeat domain-containing protein [Leptospira langatensis]TGK01485.1 ankyrin repeat domain-containing protein [Leptospira langatensis]TGL42065.1 ankyrin repeat domain-containing protein [Leptospira langatensis]
MKFRNIKFRILDLPPILLKFALRSLLILGLFFSFAISERSLVSKENSIPKIYVHNFKLETGVPKSLENRFRNGVINSILHNFEGKYNIADDDSLAALLKQAELKQRQNCSDEICMKQIADAIDADELISGTIFTSGKGYKINLRAQKRDSVALTYTIKISFDLEFPEYQIDYYSSEAGRKLIDPKYSINFAAAYPGPTDKVEFSNFKIQTDKNGEINALDFKTEDQSAKGLLDAIRPRLSYADELVREKKYEKSISEYIQTLAALEERLSDRSKKEISDYLKAIRSKISSAYFLSYQDSLSNLDSKASKGGEVSDLKNLNSDYKKLKLSYLAKTADVYRLKDFEKALDDRIEKTSLAVFGLEEKEGDRKYSDFDFTGAIQSYRSIRNDLSKIKNNPDFSAVKARIERKIVTSEITGRSYLQSKLSGFYQSLEKSFLAEGLESDPESKKIHIEKIRDGFRAVLETLGRSEFVSEEQIKNFNQFRNQTASKVGENLFDQSKADLLLLEAIDRKSKIEIDSCIKLGANPNAVDPHSDKTAAERLAGNDTILISADSLKILRNSLKTNSDLDLQFFESIRQRNLDEIVRFVLRGSDPNTKDYLGNTPLHKTAGFGYYEVSSFLLQIGAELNSKNGDGETPLHRAVAHGFYDLAGLFLRSGANPNVTRNDGMTPLHLSVNYPEIVLMLLQRGADVNMKNDDGWTPLHKAAESGDQEALKLLLRAGAKVNEKDNNGWTPMDWAVQKDRYENPNIVKILKTAGAECQVNCVE